jgi:hypothetical protein
MSEIKIKKTLLEKIEELKITEEEVREVQKLKIDPRNYQTNPKANAFMGKMGLLGIKYFYDKYCGKESLTDAWSKKLKKAWRQTIKDLDEDKIESVAILGEILAEIKRKNGKTYIFSKTFYEDFSRLDSRKVSPKYLPKNFCGTVILPSALQIRKYSQENVIKEFSFFHQKSNLNIYWLDDKIDVKGFTLTWEDPDKSVYDCFISALKVSEADKAKKDDLYDNLIGKLINLLVYLSTGNPDIRKFKNTIRRKSPTSTKAIRADKDLSETEFELVGYGWKKDPNYLSSSWYCRPYWATRHVGPKGSQQTKLVLVREHVRHRQAGKQKA